MLLGSPEELIEKILAQYEVLGQIDVGGQGRNQPYQEPLSERELEVLRLLAEGYNNKAIAAQLVLAEGTVKNYVSTILDKLHAANRTHARQIARKQGLIE